MFKFSSSALLGIIVSILQILNSDPELPYIIHEHFVEAKVDASLLGFLKMKLNS
jgi:hypothetical protein